MLILTRRVGETVMIGDDVTITVLGVKGNQVRVGINAPKHVAVHREEIYERIKREQQSAEVEKPKPAACAPACGRAARAPAAPMPQALAEKDSGEPRVGAVRSVRAAPHL